MSSDGYFEAVIEEKMNIPPIKQHDGLVVKEDFLFQITIDLCNYFNNKYKKNGRDSLRFAINWLEDMRNHPKVHKIEWDLWNQTIIEVTEQHRRSLDSFRSFIETTFFTRPVMLDFFNIRSARKKFDLFECRRYNDFVQLSMEIAVKREFQIEKEFQIVVFFLVEFWQSFLKETMINKGIINEKELAPAAFEKASIKDQEKSSPSTRQHFSMRRCFLIL